EGFFSGYFSTAIEANEMLTEVWLRNPAPGQGWAFGEVSRRQGDFALVGAVTLLSVAGGQIADSRLVLFGVGGTPFRATAAEAVLKGAKPDAEAFRAAEAKVKESVNPENDVHVSADYRRHVAGVLARRGLQEAAGRAASSRGAS
ncbi:MAG TPA: xanthine dehydrogenase family protein subunit M, partial [Candidatus Dormibacteraeota bacterium]